MGPQVAAGGAGGVGGLAEVVPPDPHLAAIFEPVAADELPNVAPVRLTELTRFMASTRYTRWPPEWRTGVDQEFQHMKLCAGVMTIPEQQAAQAQAEQQQAQMQMEAEAQKAEKSFPRLKIARDDNGRMSDIIPQAAGA